MKINELINDFSSSLLEMGDGFKEQLVECNAQLSHHKQELSRIQGYEDSEVRGFDLCVEIEDYDDSIDKLDIYAKFLGEDEYIRMKDNYQRAIYTMNELFLVEKDRIHMNAPLQWQELSEMYPADLLSRFQSVHELYQKNGGSREKYM
jgi:hypothetical protein